MILRWILLATLFSFVTSDLNTKGRSHKITTETLVKKYGYPFVKYTVPTPDGYLLEVHRIPFSPKFKVDSDEPRPVVFLMHGLLSSSSDWVVLGTPSALAFLLVDAGYDVWLGNARGNAYSRDHITYSPEYSPFWNFEWHEIAMIDLPAMIEFVCNRTGEKQVTYIGHSQGSTTFLVLNSLDKTIQCRFKSAHLLAPMAYMTHMDAPIFKWSHLILDRPKALSDLFGCKEFTPSWRLMEFLGYQLCTQSTPVSALCLNALFLISGYTMDNLSREKIPDIMATSPAGGSVNQIIHFMQEKNSGNFCQFDHGVFHNWVKYGVTKPPVYPLATIDVPIYLYYAKSDSLVAEVDVKRLINELPTSSVKQAYLVPYRKWNHLDFLWGLNVLEQVYSVVLANLESDQCQ